MSLFSTILGGASPWALAGVFAAGAATSAAVVYPVATWKERAAWTASLNDARKEASARESAANTAAAKQAADFADAVNKVNEQNKHTDAVMGDYIVTTQDISHALQGIKGKLATVQLGGCTFTSDADGVRDAAYRSAVRKASGPAEAGKAGGGDGANSRPPSPSTAKHAPSHGSGTDR